MQHLPSHSRFRVVPLAVALLGFLSCKLDDLTQRPGEVNGLSVGMAELRDSAAVGALAPRVMKVPVSAKQGTPLTWSARLTSEPNWLSLLKSGGTTPDTVVLAASVRGLAVGMHRDTLIVKIQDPVQDSVVIPVSLSVRPCSVTILSLDLPIEGELSTGDCSAPHQAGRPARVYSVQAGQNDSLSIRLESSVFAPAFVVSSGATDPPTVQSSSCGSASGVACVRYFRIPRAGIWMVEVLAADAAAVGPFTLLVTRPLPPAAPGLMRQLSADGSTSLGTGGATRQAAVRLGGTLSDPDSLDALRLELEVRPLGVAFSNTATHTGTFGPARAATVTVSDLVDATSYHWQARATDETGRASPWTPFGANAETAVDFRIDASASGLAFTDQPSSVTVNEPMAGVVEVVALDRLGLTDTEFSGTVTLALTPGSGTEGATLSGTTSVAAVRGVATFSGLRVNRVGAGYTLSATSPGLIGAASAAFDVRAGAAAALAFTVHPSNAVAGQSIMPAVRVEARDASGNLATGYTGPITISITAGTGTPGAVLGGTRTVSAVAGVAVFSNLTVDRVGVGYRLTAAASGLTSATSNTFTVTAGGVSRLAFTVQPSNVVSGAAITPAVQVTAQDAAGNTVSTFTGTVTVAITAGSGTAGAVLSGTVSVTAQAGVATFNNLRIDKAGTGYTLTASTSGATSAVSSAFAVTAGAAAVLVFTVQPTNVGSGDPITPAVQVTARDAAGNTATGFAGVVSMAITAGTGTAGAVLSGTLTATASAGVASFGNLRIDKAGTGYTLTASATGLTAAVSTAFSVSADPATRLVFTVQPSNVVSGQVITPAVQVTARDAAGNTATSFTGSVTVAITAGSGTAGAVLAGTVTVNATNGVATFSNLSINRSGTGYTLTATAAGLTSAVSSAFTVAPGPAAALFFTVQPTTARVNTAIAPAVQVTARDAAGNTATSFTGSVTVSITPGTGTGGAVLSGTLSVAAAGGVASFGDLKINLAGTAYRLNAASGSLTGASSTAFDVTP